MRRRDYERLERVDQKEKRSSKKKRGLKRKASGDSGPSSEEPTTDGVDGGLKEEEEEVDKNGLPAKVCISISLHSLDWLIPIIMRASFNP